MKASIYNFSFALSDGTTLFFNYYTLALIALKPSEARSAREILEHPDVPSKKRGWPTLKKLLIKHGFLVDDRADEIGLLRSFNARSKSDRRNLNLTIVPTLACNFRCVYCYQRQTAESMSPEVESAVVEFVRDRVVEGGNFSVTWFGGEPLLRIDIMERLSKAFLEICQASKVAYSSSIITNGYLLDGDVAGRLAALKIKEAQITLDGPPEVHDERRRLANGGATFDRILSNIRESVSKIALNIRMNVDDQNRGDIGRMLEILNSSGLNQRLGFYLGRTFPYTELCQDVSGWCLKDRDFSLLELETALDMVHRGFKSFCIPKSRNYYCMADSENAFAITPGGKMMKCWNDVTTEGAEVGHLLNPSAWDVAKNSPWAKTRDPFQIECRECIALPICMGGCPYLFRITGHLHCHDWKYYPAENLVFYYLLQKRKQETEIMTSIWEAAQSFRENEDRARE